MARYSQLGFVDAASPLMEQMIFFHDHAMVVLLLIINFVLYMMIYFTVQKFICRTIYESQFTEFIWTVVPAIILVFLALPSLRLLYMLDEIGDSALTLKCIGHQWYWSYEYSDYSNEISFDSYMIPTDDLEPGDFRLLEVDNRAVVPYGCNIRVLVTSEDVIHSWSVPSLGIKVDAIPGRLNQMGFYLNYPGIFYGQCSEICGANHSFMPICLEGVDTKSFTAWLNTLEAYQK
uniref:Cytochrome c oxidase subunit 2 n=1 Tax=Patella ferruginea TaxID=87961 RepID=A0A481MVL0_PATFE|nr:cytochrome c oxidase subunit II [Patella ferruginea]